MTLAAGIGGGVPLAALLAKEAVSVFQHGDQGHWRHPLDVRGGPGGDQ